MRTRARARTTNRRIECARDKGAAFACLLAGAAARGSEGPAVYIGDSASDIPALLAADLGIVVGANALLRRVLRAFGVKLEPLAAAWRPHGGRRAPADAPVLYEAADWHQISALLMGPGEGEHDERGAAGAGSAAGAGAGGAPPHSPGGAKPGAGARATPAAGSAGGAAAPPPRVPRALTIAGSDSGGGAGIQADLKTFAARGVFGTSACSALTAQNTRGVQAVLPVDPAFLTQQLESVLSGALRSRLLHAAERPPPHPPPAYRPRLLTQPQRPPLRPQTSAPTRSRLACCPAPAPCAPSRRRCAPPAARSWSWTRCWSLPAARRWRERTRWRRCGPSCCRWRRC